MSGFSQNGQVPFWCVVKIFVLGQTKFFFYTHLKMCGGEDPFSYLTYQQLQIEEDALGSLLTLISSSAARNV